MLFSLQQSTYGNVNHTMSFILSDFNMLIQYFPDLYLIISFFISVFSAKFVVLIWLISLSISCSDT